MEGPPSATKIFCRACGAIFDAKRRYNLVRHEAKKHGLAPVADENTFGALTCKKCRVAFSSVSNYRRHKKQFKDDTCESSSASIHSNNITFINAKRPRKSLPDGYAGVVKPGAKDQARSKPHWHQQTAAITDRYLHILDNLPQPQRRVASWGPYDQNHVIKSSRALPPIYSRVRIADLLN